MLPGRVWLAKDGRPSASPAANDTRLMRSPAPVCRISAGGGWRMPAPSGEGTPTADPANEYVECRAFGSAKYDCLFAAVYCEPDGRCEG